MRVLILHFLSKENSKHNLILKNLLSGAESNGNQVDLVSGTLNEDVHFALYDYISVVISSSVLFGSKIPSKVIETLEVGHIPGGKKGAALVVKSGFSSNKTSRVLMKAMEKEGIMLDYFDVILNSDHAVSVGKKLG